MNKNNLIIAISFCALTQEGLFAQNDINFIVQYGLVGYDTAKSLSKAAHVVVEADTALTRAGMSLNLSGPVTQALELGAGANFIFIAPLNDGRYFIQALAQNDLKNIAYYAGKLGLYFYAPLCYGAAGYLEAGNELFKLYNKAMEKNLQWRSHYANFAKNAACNLL